MIKIIQRSRSPTEEDLSFVTDDYAEKYIKDLISGTTSESLIQKFQEFSPHLLEILGNLLEINPYYRKPVSELLKSPLFDSIRNEPLERPASEIIRLDIDEDESPNFDFREAIIK